MLRIPETEDSLMSEKRRRRLKGWRTEKGRDETRRVSGNA